MLNTHWFLTMVLLFPTGQVKSDGYVTYREDYCIDYAKKEWRAYYLRKQDAEFSVFCRDANSAKSIRIICDREGNCDH